MSAEQPAGYIAAADNGGMTPDERVLLSIAIALYAVSEGYTAEDLKRVPFTGWASGSAPHQPEHPDDRRAKAVFMGHARLVVQHLLAAGWTPPPGDEGGAHSDRNTP